MGKVASDKCHKWVFKEPPECEQNIANYWQSSFDSLPSEWTDQFESGIQTIAVIQAGDGLLQLGSCKIIPEDLHFVLRMRHTFESLGYQSGFYLSQIFSSNRITSSSSIPTKTPTILGHPPHVALFSWPQGPLFGHQASMLSNPNCQNHLALPQAKDEPHVLSLPNYLNEARVEELIGQQHEDDIKWADGLYFNALSSQPEEAKLLLHPDVLENKPDHPPDNCQLHSLDKKSLNQVGPANPNEFLSSHSESARKMENKSTGSSTLPTRMTNLSSSASIGQQPVE